ncbi:MAG: hypothetical protein PHY47_00075 [Lachnospiraceae bacterium]|nr:hypothetical protein [Lachnospiraceae bacterium]
MSLINVFEDTPSYNEEESYALAQQARELRRQLDAGLISPRSYSELVREYERNERPYRDRDIYYFRNIIDKLFDKIESLENEVENLKERLDTIDFYKE